MLSSTFWDVLAANSLLIALGQTIAFCEAKLLCLKANLLRAKALLPKVNLLLAKVLLQKAALLDWSAPTLTSELILQPFCCFTYVTAHSPTLLLLLLHHWLFTYVTWRATHDCNS